MWATRPVQGALTKPCLRLSRLRGVDTITVCALELGMFRDELDERESLYALVCWQQSLSVMSGS